MSLEVGTATLAERGDAESTGEGRDLAARFSSELGSLTEVAARTDLSKVPGNLGATVKAAIDTDLHLFSAIGKAATGRGSEARKHLEQYSEGMKNIGLGILDPIHAAADFVLSADQAVHHHANGDAEGRDEQARLALRHLASGLTSAAKTYAAPDAALMKDLATLGLRIAGAGHKEAGAGGQD